MRRAVPFIAAAAAFADGASLGDRLVLEHKWLGAYEPMPLTATAAKAAGWNVSDTCEAGRGRMATGGHSSNHTLALWYTQQGEITGYHASVAPQMASPPWKVGPGGSEIGFIFRDPATICAGALDATTTDPSSIGDRLLLITQDPPLELPLTEAGAKAENFIDTKSCLTDMGHHYIMPFPDSLKVSPVMTMYWTDGTIDGVLCSSIPTEPTPPFEKFNMFGTESYSLHLYFKEHKGACNHTTPH
eukprot:Hpha_TRINITY_DN15676_c0_g1::TRINITY_DN15676_c0_g1_i1::g.99860::m.99860